MRELKESRALSFAVIAVIYIIATVIGVATYKALGFDWWLSLLVADAVATVVTFIFSLGAFAFLLKKEKINIIQQNSETVK